MSFGGLTNLVTLVLAATFNLHLFRTALTRPTLSHLLPPTILASARTGVRPISCDVLVAAAVCYNLPPRPKYLYHILTLPRLGALQHTRLHLVAAEPRHPT